MSERKRLAVYIAGVLAGNLYRDARGEETFEYEANYAGVPLSLSMPLSAKSYGRDKVRPYLFGLLPDDRETRRRLGLRYGVSGENPLALLEHIGLDCPGAVQICPVDSPELLDRGETLVPLSDADIAARLSDLNSREAIASWILEDEHWSLGGTQNKFALRRLGGEWFQCGGSAATTHIIKPGITRLKYQALDEYACMLLAKTVGLPCADVDYCRFLEEPAIVVSRFDRLSLPDGTVVRIHQEDMCQALSVMPDHKYTFEGGPAAADILVLLRKAGGTREALAFVGMLFYNYLIGASDAHAKNYSVLLGSDGGASLAPLYDVASILPYDSLIHMEARAAMGIGGENRFGRVGKRAIRRFAEQNELDEELCLNVMGNLAERIICNADRVHDNVARLPGGDELGERLFPPIEHLCTSTLAQLT